jgi:N-acyl-L-homoserine lactone synthetase
MEIATARTARTETLTEGTVRYHEESDHRYAVRHLAWDDYARHAAYQTLRAQVFVYQQGWDVPVSHDGREFDRYDVGGGHAIHVACIFGADDDHVEHLLAGVRIFRLRSWSEAMLAHEFIQTGMVPPKLLNDLEERLSPNSVLELTRLCVFPRRLGSRKPDAQPPALNLSAMSVPTRSDAPPYAVNDTPPQWTYAANIARDLCYASVYAFAEAYDRRYLVALIEKPLFHALVRSGFVVEALHTIGDDQRRGYVVVLLDLYESMLRFRATGRQEQADRFLAVCQEPEAFPWRML